MYSCKLPISGLSTQDQGQTGPKPQVNTRRSLFKKKNFLHWSSLLLHRLLTVVAFLVVEHRLQGAQAQQLWYTGLAARQHVESSQIRDQTHVPCTGRQILIH
ncbi:unnamed protein product [Rangifer tarandus platyrhynchus]|uniref:Uncharacterized protein n=1 Tax=Rangifer tarandus platyrhynchus TaxID=3082113 RepID=A0AC59ZTK6_RANTA